MSKIVVGTNSWILLADADEYFSTRIGSENIWNEELDEEKREASLITSFNVLLNCGLFTLVASDTSSNVKNAQCEMALFLLVHGEDIDKRKGLQAQGVVSAGIVQESYDKDKLYDIPIPNIVRGLLKDSMTQQGIYVAPAKRDDDKEVNEGESIVE